MLLLANQLKKSAIVDRHTIIADDILFVTPALLCSTSVVIGCSSELFIFCSLETKWSFEYHAEDGIVYLFYTKISGLIYYLLTNLKDTCTIFNFQSDLSTAYINNYSPEVLDDTKHFILGQMFYKKYCYKKKQKVNAIKHSIIIKYRIVYPNYK